MKYVMSNRDFCMILDPEETSPFVIAVPHDALVAPASLSLFVQERPHGLRHRDVRTFVIARTIAQIIPVAIVRGLLPRSIVDYNRRLPRKTEADIPLSSTTEHALVDEQVLPTYLYYHRANVLRLDAAQRAHGPTALFIDLHGFTHQPPYAPADGYDFVLGTANRKTIVHDNNVDCRLAQALRCRGYSVFLPTDTVVLKGKSDHFNGGITVRRMAAQSGSNAIQIEVASRLRQKNTVEKTGRDLAACLASLVP